MSVCFVVILVELLLWFYKTLLIYSTPKSIFVASI